MKRIEAGLRGRRPQRRLHRLLDLDEMLRGLQPGEMIILAARPSMGKTALALNLAEQIAFGGHAPPIPAPAPDVGVAFFSLEMSKNAVVQRLLSARSGVSGQTLRGGHASPTTSSASAHHRRRGPQGRARSTSTTRPASPCSTSAPAPGAWSRSTA
jgi:hypothetical protein